ncbi:hypothetical protein AMECASPLE_039164 [Ameca splendens]|uniref:Uncharacterized protein n=1 Tax=Ameca splendens TaxID=208324 RepID=A0ABV1AI58_9TELE
MPQRIKAVLKAKGSPTRYLFLIKWTVFGSGCDLDVQLSAGSGPVEGFRSQPGVLILLSLSQPVCRCPVHEPFQIPLFQ